VLAGRVLGAANSAANRGTAPMRTVRDAVQRLGLTEVRDLVMAEAITLRIFSTGGGYADTMAKLRVHSLATARLAGMVAQATGIDGGYAFLCGLLHDIGLAAILLALGSISRGEVPPDLAALWPIAVAAHGTIGAQIARLWTLPEEIARVIEHHADAPGDGEPSALVAAVALAEDLGATWGIALRPELGAVDSYLRPDLVAAGAVAAARRRLGVDVQAMDRLVGEALKLLSTLR
jgi:putative nucleotidyltransferase with HDIG domain